jgi:hypothetical protein
MSRYMKFQKLIKTFTLSAALSALAAQAIAASCHLQQTEYLVDWTSFSTTDVDSSGRPTRAYALPVDKTTSNNPAIRVQLNLEYAGDVRRFALDHPKIARDSNAEGGILQILKNLLQTNERKMSETRIRFDQPVEKLTIDVTKADDNSDFGRNYFDRVSVLGKTDKSKFHSPSVRPFLPSGPDEPAPMNHQRELGPSGANIFPIDVPSLGLDGYASYQLEFDKDVSYMTFQLTSLSRLFNAHPTSKNPSPQDHEVSRMTFCVDQ